MSWIDCVHPIAFVDWLAHDTRPSIIATFEKVIEPINASHINELSMHCCPLASYLGLRDGARTDHVDRRTREQGDNIEALLPSGLAGFDRVER